MLPLILIIYFLGHNSCFSAQPLTPVLELDEEPGKGWSLRGFPKEKRATNFAQISFYVTCLMAMSKDPDSGVPKTGLSLWINTFNSMAQKGALMGFNMKEYDQSFRVGIQKIAESGVGFHINIPALMEEVRCATPTTFRHLWQEWLKGVEFFYENFSYSSDKAIFQGDKVSLDARLKDYSTDMKIKTPHGVVLKTMKTTLLHASSYEEADFSNMDQLFHAVKNVTNGYERPHVRLVQFFDQAHMKNRKGNLVWKKPL